MYQDFQDYHFNIQDIFSEKQRFSDLLQFDEIRAIQINIFMPQCHVI